MLSINPSAAPSKRPSTCNLTDLMKPHRQEETKGAEGSEEADFTVNNQDGKRKKKGGKKEGTHHKRTMWSEQVFKLPLTLFTGGLNHKRTSPKISELVDADCPEDDGGALNKR